MSYNTHISNLGPNIIRCKYDGAIDRDLLTYLCAVVMQIRQDNPTGLVDIVKTYDEIALHFSNASAANAFDKELLKLNIAQQATTATPILHSIDVHYTPSHEDFHYVLKHNNLTVDQLISLHSSTTYDVHFVGFLPGFLYLGGLHPRLWTPRKQKPSPSIEGGSIAIGGRQTGIYPERSPGGWQIIGYSDHPLFSIDQDPPMKINAGDFIRFRPV